MRNDRTNLPSTTRAVTADAWPPAFGTASLSGSVAHPGEPCVAHEILITVDHRLDLAGTSHWRANASRGLAARSFALLGSCDASGRVEFFDDTPERLPGYRRGVYVGMLDTTRGCLSGQYYEIDECTHELFYWGDWTATRRPGDGRPQVRR